MSDRSASEGWRSSRLKLLQVRLIAAFGYPTLHLLGRTLRWRVDGLHHFDVVAAAGHHPIIGFWHGRILAGLLYFQHRGIVVMTSENFDGEWIGRIIRRFGYEMARGSTSHGGSRALRQLVRHMRQGRGTGLTLDGPRGPARVAQPGAVFLAKATGCPIVPIHLEASRHWTLGSWDRTQIPKPFATVSLAIGDPLYVPSIADEAALENARVELERRLGLLQDRAAQMIHD